MKPQRNIVLALASLLVLIGTAWAADYIEAVDVGNEAYYNGDYTTALEQYRIAEAEIPESPELDYNLAGALYHQGKYEETVERYSRALNTTDITLEAQSHYNLGNTHYRMQDYQNAIMAYQKALEIDPEDVDAKFNLELARKMLKEQIKPENEEQQEQQQQQQEQQQQEEEQQEQEQQQQQQQQDEQQQEEQQQQQQPQPQDDQEMSKEDAERILNALRDDEQDIQKDVRRQRVRGDYQGKDW
jgi:tetratricopeptide (TPR) repeat protein